MGCSGECVVAWAVVVSVWFYGMYNDACGVLVSRHTHWPPSNAKVGKGGETSGELGMVLATCTGAASLSPSLFWFNGLYGPASGELVW